MSDEKHYMLMFSFGPVQSFIAQARKTRDLMLGSFLLSMMMEAAMKGLDDKLVFPADPTIQNDISDLPNKFVALFNDQEAALRAAKDSKERIQNLWNTMREEVWQQIIKPALSSKEEEETRKIWDQQSDPGRFFEIFWVVAEGSPTQYTAWLDDAQKALDARKRFRNFEQQDEKGEKSTISGEREALRGKGRSRDEVKAFWKRVVLRELSEEDEEILPGKHLSSKDISLDGSERLDAIDTIKRFALYSSTVKAKLRNRAFPSTSMVAAASFIESLLTAPLEHAVLQGWIDTMTEHFGLPRSARRGLPRLENEAKTRSGEENVRLRLLQLDGDLYFPETFASQRMVEDYSIPESNARRAAAQGREALRELLAVTDKLNIPRPTPYYAFIQMDGDRMGTILGDVEDKDEHRAVSEALSNFSKYVPELVEEQYPGRLAYSGGDDVVAIAPLARNKPQEASGIKTVLDLVDRLQQEYKKTVRESVSKEENKERVTASAGIAIAHHLTSLSYVRRAAKQAEDSAKRHYGRNALVVTVLRRSGEQTRVGCRWHYDGLSEEGQPISLFTKFWELFQQDLLSPKCVYSLLEEAPVLARLEKEAQASEIRRVLLRQRSDKEKLSDSEVHELSQHLANLAEKMDQDREPHVEGQERSTELHAEGRRYGLVEVLGWLLVTVFLARKELE